MIAIPERWRGPGLAGAGGLLLALSVPPAGFWPLALPGIALVDTAISDAPVRARFQRGSIAGLALLLPTIWWMHALTLPGYVVAAVFLSALLGLALAACPPGAGRVMALPGTWLLWEGLRGRWPFGGVPLSQLALGQVAGPLAPVARVGSALLLGLVTVVAGVALALAIRRRWQRAGLAAGGVAVALLLAAVAPSGSGTGRHLDVALVQGGGPQGTRAEDTDERIVFERHLAASELVRGPVELVLWPEDVVDVEGPVTGAREGDELSALAQELGAVLVAGVIEGDGDRFRNAATAFDGDGGGAVVDRAEKERRVPFGEYVPLRRLIEGIAGDDLVPRDAIVGRGVPVLDTPVGQLGVLISWEVFFADRARDAVGHGGQLLLNPTNGSSFSGTQVQGQQVAASRLRAIETGRWVLQAAPTGFTAIVSPRGTVHDRTGVSERAVVHGRVELRSGITWAVRFGDWPTLALGGLLVAGGWTLARRRAQLPGETADSS